jgi:hypothetical protein
MEHHRTRFFKRARTAEAEVNRRITPVEELIQVTGQRTLVRQDPCTGLKYVAICAIGPRPKRRIRGKPRLFRHHMTSYVTDFGQSQRYPLSVHCGAEEIINRSACCAQSSLLSFVVGGACPGKGGNGGGAWWGDGSTTGAYAANT